MGTHVERQGEKEEAGINTTFMHKCVHDRILKVREGSISQQE